MGDISPDPANALSGYKYVFRYGRQFEESSDLLVLLYLWTHAWRKDGNFEDAPRGWVQGARTSAGSITTETGLNRGTVRNALERLEASGWIETEYVDDANPRRGRNIWVRVDCPAHEARKADGWVQAWSVSDQALVSE